MINRRRWLMRSGIVACVMAGILTWLGWRASAERAAIDAVSQFDAAVYAQYGEYEYEPPLKIHPTGDLTIQVPASLPPDQDEPEPYENTLTLVIGRGQCVVGYIVLNEPPPLIAWAAPLFDEGIGAHVTEIEVCEERFSDDNVDLLLAFPTLRELNLSRTDISDDGLSKLAASLDQLVKLDVSDTKVTGRSTRLLSNCKQLLELDLRETADSETVAEELQKELPECLIFR